MFDFPYIELFCVQVRGEDDYRLITADVLEAIDLCTQLLNAGFISEIRKIN